MSPSQASETCASASSATSACGEFIMRTGLDSVKKPLVVYPRASRCPPNRINDFRSRGVQLAGRDSAKSVCGSGSIFDYGMPGHRYRNGDCDSGECACSGCYPRDSHAVRGRRSDRCGHRGSLRTCHIYSLDCRKSHHDQGPAHARGPGPMPSLERPLPTIKSERSAKKGFASSRKIS